MMITMIIVITMIVMIAMITVITMFMMIIMIMMMFQPMWDMSRRKINESQSVVFAFTHWYNTPKILDLPANSKGKSLQTPEGFAVYLNAYANERAVRLWTCFCAFSEKLKRALFLVGLKRDSPMESSHWMEGCVVEGWPLLMSSLMHLEKRLDKSMNEPVWMSTIEIESLIT